MLAKLMKYELIRRRNAMLMILASTIVVEGFILYQIYRSNDEFAFFMNVVMFIAMNIVLIYENVKLLSDDLNKQSGYMVFLTPNSGYAITGAKMLVGFIEVILGYLLVCGFVFGNMALLYEVTESNIVYGLLEGLKQASVIIDELNITIFDWIISLFNNLTKWFSFVVLIYLAIILRKTIFSNIKFKGAISFITFILLSSAVGFLSQSLFYAVIASNDVFVVTGNNVDLATQDLEVFKNLIRQLVHLDNVLNLIVIGLAFYVSGFLLNKKVDL